MLCGRHRNMSLLCKHKIENRWKIIALNAQIRGRVVYCALWLSYWDMTMFLNSVFAIRFCKRCDIHRCRKYAAARRGRTCAPAVDIAKIKDLLLIWALLAIKSKWQVQLSSRIFDRLESHCRKSPPGRGAKQSTLLFFFLENHTTTSSVSANPACIRMFNRPSDQINIHTPKTWDTHKHNLLQHISAFTYIHTCVHLIFPHEQLILDDHKTSNFVDGINCMMWQFVDVQNFKLFVRILNAYEKTQFLNNSETFLLDFQTKARSAQSWTSEKFIIKKRKVLSLSHVDVRKFKDPAGGRA